MESSCELVVQKRDKSTFSCNSLFINYLYSIQVIDLGRKNSFIDPARELEWFG
jgi:hypothetical protein